MNSTTFTLGVLLVTAAWPAPVAAQSIPTRLVMGLQGASGSTVGPDKALYVTEGAAGRISRVDPETGEITTFASGLPTSIIGFGGPTDITFIGNTAYVLVTLVGPPFGGDIVGIYRVDGPTNFAVIADIGAFAQENPPDTPFGGPQGLQYAIEPYRGGFLVTDGHHNRVLRVTRDGGISVFRAFDNIVPTGLAIWGQTVYMAQAGPLPHLPQDGKVVSFTHNSPEVADVASGAPLMVDVEFGRGRTLFALSQGVWPIGGPEASPALPNTGTLLRVLADGTFDVVADSLNQPTSFEVIGNTAYVVTLTGEIWKIEDVA
jgi:sugar lactone lactonase YvrE